MDAKGYRIELLLVSGKTVYGELGTLKPLNTVVEASAATIFSNKETADKLAKIAEKYMMVESVSVVPVTAPKTSNRWYHG